MWIVLRSILKINATILRVTKPVATELLLLPYINNVAFKYKRSAIIHQWIAYKQLLSMEVILFLDLNINNILLQNHIPEVCSSNFKVCRSCLCIADTSVYGVTLHLFASLNSCLPRKANSLLTVCKFALIQKGEMRRYWM